MKKAILFIVCLLLTGVPIAAEEVDITLDVPAAHTVTIDSAGGRIVKDGVVYADLVTVERHTAPVYWILPDDGMQLVSLYYDGEDVSDQVVQNVWQAPTTFRDGILTAAFAAVPAPDARRYDLSLSLTGQAAEDVVLEMAGVRGRLQEDGSIFFKAIPSGMHSIVVWADDVVLAHGTIMIEEAQEAALAFMLDAQGNAHLLPSTSTSQLSLRMYIDADGQIVIDAAADRTPKEETVLTAAARTRWPVFMAMTAFGAAIWFWRKQTRCRERETSA